MKKINAVEVNKKFSIFDLIKSELLGLIHPEPKNRNKDYIYPEKIGDYKFDKVLFDGYRHRSYRYAIYDYKGKKGFAKIWQGTYKNFDYFSLKNEYFVYNSLSKIEPAEQRRLQKEFPNIKAPSVINFIENKNNTILLIDLINGKTIKEVSLKAKLSIYENLMKYLNQLTPSLIKDKSIQTRSLKNLIFLYPALLLLSILKNPQNFGLYFNCLKLFLYVTLDIYHSKEVSFIHKSLEDQNIIRTKESVYLIDFQLAVLSHPYFEIAQTLFFSWGNAEFRKEFLKTEEMKQILSSSKKLKMLKIIVIYTALQQIALGLKNTDQCAEYIKFFLNIEASQLVVKKTPFEIVYSLSLNLISFFYKATGIERYSKNKKIVLCYHSIGNSNWRFSTKPEDFQSQIKILSNNYRITTLPNLLKQKGGGLSITFDDGYKDVYQNALPVLEKNKIKATMFVLGNSEKANRVALDNNLPMLSNQEIKKLRNKGWEIGFHTETHSDLVSLSDRKLKDEIIVSKKALEKKLGFGVRYFAYPKGFYTDRIINYAKEAGFEGAFTINGKEMDSKNVMILDRVPMEGELSTDQFEALISPIGLAMTGFFMSILKFKQGIMDKSRMSNN